MTDINSRLPVLIEEERMHAIMAGQNTDNPLIVGTVGGGTGLPTQKACLELMGLYGDGKASAFAEVCAATTLAGELSIIAALANGSFARAHKILARARKES